MKKPILFLSVLIALFVSCKKDYEIPTYPMTGVWHARDTTLQLVINNTNNQGLGVKYQETNSNGNRVLKQSIFGYVTTYNIITVTKYAIVLTDSTTRQIAFYKTADL